MGDENLKFEVAHIGINCENEKDALRFAELFSLMFNFDIKKGNSSIFASKSIELMKNKYLGQNGHIAIKTNDMDNAIKVLSIKGLEFDDNTLKFDSEGNKLAIYFKDEIAGFAIHLLKG